MHIPYRCPLCSCQLELKERSFVCANNHCFDQAKEGYVNLLPVQNKKSKSPGDNLEMIQARTRFLSAGYYEPFCDALANAMLRPMLSAQTTLGITSSSKATLKAHSKARSKDSPTPDTTNRTTDTARDSASYRSNLGALLDIGCGNGWYSERIRQQLDVENIHGIDISKHATKTAAKRYRKSAYAVASAFALPYEDASFDSVLCVFSPLKLSEALRVLKPGGVLVFAGPGPSHLKELASFIYDEVHKHKGNPVEFDEQHNLQNFETSNHRERCLIENKDIPDLLAMTPYYWSASETQKQRIAEIENLTVQLDFDITVAVKRELH